MDYIGFLIKLIYDEIDREVNRKLVKHGLTSSQVAVLIFLHTQERAQATIKDIQRFLNVSQPTATGLVRRLEKKGFVRVFEDPQDRRVRIVRLTNETSSVYESIQSLMRETEAMLMQGFSAQERDQVYALLNRIYQNTQASKG